MRESFQDVAAALWASLGLAPPRVEAHDRAVLRIDGRAVALCRSPDGGHVVVTTTVGSLAPQPHRQGEQLRALLRDSLGLMLTNRAGLQFAGEGVGVEAVAVGPCSAAQVPFLRALIEDVVHLAEIHATTLEARAGTLAVGRPDRDDGDSVIFRL